MALLCKIFSIMKNQTLIENICYLLRIFIQSTCVIPFLLYLLMWPQRKKREREILSDVLVFKSYNCKKFSSIYLHKQYGVKPKRFKQWYFCIYVSSRRNAYLLTYCPSCHRQLGQQGWMHSSTIWCSSFVWTQSPQLDEIFLCTVFIVRLKHVAVIFEDIYS